MLATSLSVIDPLLTSPQRAKRHDDDMAALQKSCLQQLNMMSPIELPPSAVAVSTSSSEASLLSLSLSSQQQQEREPEALLKEEEAVVKQVDEQPNDNEVEGADADDDKDKDAETQLYQLMNRGNYLRQLRLLALADEQERQEAQAQQELLAEESSSSNEEEKKEDSPHYCRDNNNNTTTTEMESSIHILPSSKEKVLDYESYLAHQRYYDDLKHVDIKYMDFGNMMKNKNANANNNNNNGHNNENENGGRLVVEQRKRLGKGGFVWDAGFILGEHVIAHEHEWNSNSSTAKNVAPPRVVELGAGTGLTGMMVAKATKSDVVVTDLPELADLMRDNIALNFGTTDADATDNSQEGPILTTNEKQSHGTISSKILRWGIEEDYAGGPYDVILGADIVTSLYDPVALAQTLHALSGPETKIYISGKSRLDKPHEEFDVEMHRLFGSVGRIERPGSRLRSPNVFIIVAGNRREI